MEERLQEVLQTASRYHVSDIHLTRYPNEPDAVSIEMRINGVMKRLKRKKDDLQFFHYLMYRANLDVSAAMRPQTGSFEEEVGGKILSIRFSIITAGRMMSGVLRILNQTSGLKVEDLTWDPEMISYLRSIPSYRNGLFVFSGPTGSGKTTALYTILNSAENKRVFTLEDPIEVVNEKFVQLQVNERQNLSYAEGIKQLMRHQPDILMIGEIRDSVAAKMAVRCALTGHLVVTSIHSGHCTTAIHRLMDLGVEQYQLEDVLFGITCQRLYETGDGRRTAVFERMSRREVQYYFEHGRNEEGFRTLEERIEEAVSLGYVSYEDAKADLIV